MTEKNKKNIYTVIAVASIMLVMVVAKAYYRSAKEFYMGEDALKKQEFNMAITHFERSIHWHTPFNKYVSDSAPNGLTLIVY